MAPSSKQRYEAPSSGSDSDSSVEAQPRRAPRLSRDDDEDSVDGLDTLTDEDEEMLVGLEEPVREKKLRRRWLMASLPTPAGAPGATKTPSQSWLSGKRLVYLGLTGVAVLGLIIFGSVLLWKEYNESSTDSTSLAKPESTSAYIPTGTMPNLGVPFPTGMMQRFPELQALIAGNRQFRSEEENEHPGLVETLAQGQHPKFAYLGCSDSRVPETEIFGAQLGDLFVTRNVGNQFTVDDLSSETVFTYAIAHLGVSHLIVQGHYGCGAVQAAIASEADDTSTDIGSARIEAWIRPIRSLFRTPNHSEIVAFRTAYSNAETIPPPNRTNPAFRALVEENVKQQVLNLADDPSVQKSWKAFFAGGGTSASAKGSETATTTASISSSSMTALSPNITASSHRKRSDDVAKPVELWIHGWVYDIDTGLVQDLGVSVGPSAR